MRGMTMRHLRDDFDVLEHFRREPDTRRGEPIGALGPDAHRAEPATDAPILPDAALFKDEDVLQGDDVTFHAGNLADGRHLPGAVGHTCDLNDDLERGGDLLPN